MNSQVRDQFLSQFQISILILGPTQRPDSSFHRFRQNIATTTIKYVEGSSTLKPEDTVTRVFGCATMWHESEEEVTEMLKSIFRIDEDYSAR